MESLEVKIRKITAAYEVKNWELKDGSVILHFGTASISFDISGAEFEDAKGQSPLNIVLEIPVHAKPSEPPIK